MPADSGSVHTPAKALQWSPHGKTGRTVPAPCRQIRLNAKQRHNPKHPTKNKRQLLIEVAAFYCGAGVSTCRS